MSETSLLNGTAAAIDSVDIEISSRLREEKNAQIYFFFFVFILMFHF